MMSCKVTKVYYHDTSTFDDGEILGGNVNAFFQTDPNITVINSKSKKLLKELDLVISKINAEGAVFEKDDMLYDYAFITSKGDTLYSNGLVIWRHKNKQARIVSQSLEEFIKAPN